MDDISQADLPHAHSWQLISKTYAPARRDHVQGLEGDVLNHALFGVTTLLWECVICKEMKRANLLGSDTPQLDELLDKTELYGPQYFQREGITYMLSRFVANQSNLPVR